MCSYCVVTNLALGRAVTRSYATRTSVQSSVEACFAGRTGREPMDWKRLGTGARSPWLLRAGGVIGTVEALPFRRL